MVLIILGLFNREFVIILSSLLQLSIRSIEQTIKSNAINTRYIFFIHKC